MLSIADYSQQDTDAHKRSLVHRNDEWRKFFTINQRRKDQDKIIEIINKCSINGDLKNDLDYIIIDYLDSKKKDWKYYFIKYDNQLHSSSTQGYYYWKDRINLPLEIVMLNSSYESSSNLEWNIFNWILYDNNKGISTLDYHGASSLVLFKVGISINGIQNGYEVKAINENNSIVNQLVEENIISREGLFVVTENEDFIEKGQELICKIEKIAEIINI